MLISPADQDVMKARTGEGLHERASITNYSQRVQRRAVLYVKASV